MTRQDITGYLRFVAGYWWFPPLMLLVLAVAGYGAWQLGRPRLLAWRGDRAAVQARQFLAAHDLPKADLALEIALRDHPSVETYRLAGDFFEAFGSEQAVEARHRAAQLAGDPDSLLLEFAATALRFNDVETARSALGSVSPAGRGSADYRRADAACLMLTGNLAAAEPVLDGLHRELPGDTKVRLLYDNVLLRQADATKVASARDDLRRLAHDDPAREPETRRMLLADAIEHRDPFLADESLRATIAAPSATLSDLLDAAIAEKIAHPSGPSDPHLTDAIRHQASADPVSAARYTLWLLAHRDSPAAASAWLDEVPASFLKAPAITEAEADVAAAQSDWSHLERLLKRGAWGPIPPAGLEFAFAAHLVYAQGNEPLARETWTEAIQEVRASAQSLKALSRLAGLWHWPDGLQASLLATVRAFPREEAAAQSLIGLLRSRGDSHALLEVLTLRRDALPAASRRVADWAVLSLLLTPAPRPNLPLNALADLFKRYPADPFIATDYALALSQVNQAKKAADLVDHLPAAERAVPERAPYLAAIYAAAGRPADAQAAILRAPARDRLLPEEVALLVKATTRPKP